LEEVFRVLFSVLFAGGICFGLKGETGIAIAFTVSDFVSAIALFILYYKRKGRLVMPAEFNELIVQSTPLTLMRVFGGLVSGAIAIFIPARLVDSGLLIAEATAAYGRVAGMSLPLITAPTALTGALAVVLIPEIVAAYKNPKGNLKGKIEGSLAFSLLISALFLSVYIPLGGEITELIFDDKIAGEFVKRCSIIIIPLCITQITNSILNSLGLEKVTFKNFIFGTMLLMLSIFVLPKYIGVYSLAVGLGLCHGVTAVLNLIRLKKTANFNLAGKGLLSLILFVPLSVLITYFLKGVLSHYLPTFFVVGICGGVSVSILGILCFTFNLVDFKGLFVKHNRKNTLARLFNFL
jgi:O-antigen/teichoic acid export membrane protein